MRLRLRVIDADDIPGWAHPVLFALYVVLLLLLAPWLFKWLDMYAHWVFGK